MTIELDSATAECAGSISGAIRSATAGPARVSLQWATSGDGTPDKGTAHTVELSDGNGRFELPVPADGPMSFEGKLISVRWEVAVQAGDATETVEVTVLPRGGLTVWVRNTAPPPGG